MFTFVRRHKINFILSCQSLEADVSDFRKKSSNKFITLLLTNTCIIRLRIKYQHIQRCFLVFLRTNNFFFFLNTLKGSPIRLQLKSSLRQTGSLYIFCNILLLQCLGFCYVIHLFVLKLSKLIFWNELLHVSAHSKSKSEQNSKYQK